MKNFALKTGIDARIVWFIPLATALTVVVYLALTWVVSGACQLPDGQMLPVLLVFAVYLMPFTLPFALGSWVLARLLCWKARLSEHRSAMLSGFLAGLAATTVPVLWYMPQTIRAGVIALSLPGAFGGLLAGGIVYWPGWALLPWVNKG